MTTRVIIVALTVLAFVAGCGGSKTGPSSSPTEQAPQSQRSPAGLVVDITISNGAVPRTRPCDFCRGGTS
jgi:hypothetical protein